MTHQYGLIGYPLSHSFSPGYFNEKFKVLGIDAEYAAYPIQQIEDFPLLIQKQKFDGMNVTIPYKESIMSFLDEIDVEAAIIGAVNTIQFTEGKTKGFNTDTYGFEKSLLDMIGTQDAVSAALVLGTGGASKAVCYSLQKLGIAYHTVSRQKTGDLTYRDINDSIIKKHNLIINTTPLGMHPDTESCPKIPYKSINEKYFLYDLVYNPEKTIFLSEGTARGCQTKNGMEMLILQAERAWQIWNQPEK